MFCFQASEAKDDSNKISQYVPLDEDEHKEIDRTHNLNSARTFFYQGEAECDSNMKVFIDCIDAVKGTIRNLKKSNVSYHQNAQKTIEILKNIIFLTHWLSFKQDKRGSVNLICLESLVIILSLSYFAVIAILNLRIDGRHGFCSHQDHGSRQT